MTESSIVQIVLYLATLVGLSIPLGNYMAQVFQSERVFTSPVLAPIENLIYRLSRVNPLAEMTWREYGLAMVIFNGIGLLFVYANQRLQNFLPLNPQGLQAPSADSAFNTAVSFVSNTNWQSYSGEVTLSYLTQMLALTVQNFVSAATGVAILVALIRGIARQESRTIGNFWSDLVKSILYVLLPLSTIVALLLCSEGVVQTFDPSVSYEPIEDSRPLAKSTSGNIEARSEPDTQPEDSSQRQTHQIARGPAASQVAIKQLGTNGGGFFNTNSCHPLENPTPFTNLIECLSLLLIPAALCHTFGKMVGDRRQGWAILAAMSVVFIACLAVCISCETSISATLQNLGVDAAASSTQPGGNMEGKEVRFGIGNSALWATATTAASNGSVNA
ncbi:MAG: potassium-transporting ATPase subunit KdpA, partial [Cyanobacteria bacterium]|nr:potassium-transporting ATPase subunit KdpA [Cyanobacteriota bacterium]